MIRLLTLALFPCFAAGQLVSPDNRFALEYIESPAHEGNVHFKDTATGKILHTAISSGYDQSRFLEVVWSPDSRYLAVISRGTKTTADVGIFRFEKNSVEPVPVCDYRLNLFGRHNLVRGGRYQWVGDLRWEKGHLVFLAICSLADGEPDQKATYQVTLSVGDHRTTLGTVIKSDR